MSEKLKIFRKKFDNIDNRILNLLNKRTQISKQIGKYKKQNTLPIQDKNREKQLLTNIQKKAKKQNLNKKYINQLFKIILKNSRDNQK